jgi:hypothetical protein
VAGAGLISSRNCFPINALTVTAGPEYRDIKALFNQARERLAPGGVVYLLLSSDSDLELLGELIHLAHFSARQISARSIYIEDFILYELRTFS